MTLLHLWDVRKEVEYARCYYDNNTRLAESIAGKPHQEWDDTTKVCVV